MILLHNPPPVLWRSKHIGTIHTVKGKENRTVILVLGCDPQKAGGAIWAASKPNLINVALTRAKKNIYVIGDPIVWGYKTYFQDVTKVLLYSNNDRKPRE